MWIESLCLLVFFLHHYHDDDEIKEHGCYRYNVFMHFSVGSVWNGDLPGIPDDNRFKAAVEEWAKRQLQLEDMILRTAKVLKAIVHSCNTVGQYKRVSPDLLTFLPEKYQRALKDYTKKSPYPAITVEPEEIDTAISTLAYAALQPTHPSEEDYNRVSWNRVYRLGATPRTVEYLNQPVRQLDL